MEYNLNTNIDWQNVLNRKNSTIKSRGNDNDDDDDDTQGLPLLLKRNVTRNGSNIYFYDEIDDETQMLLFQAVEQATDYLIHKYANSLAENQALPEPITLHINSVGGSAVSSFAIYDFLKAQSIPIVGEVEGLATSGATIMLCGCYHRAMTKHSLILCHELRSGMSGKYSELKDDSINNNVLMELVKDIYMKETSISEKEIDMLLSHDIYWDATTAMKYGIIEQIIGDPIDDESLEKLQKLRVERMKKNGEILSEKKATTKKSKSVKRTTKKSADSASKSDNK
jgi:ATP-dependent protease ClpP protease subunit